MASPGPSSPPASPPTRRRAPAASSSNDSALPPDVLFDVLLRLPAKELCRLRAVCRSWRSLTIDPLFIGAHAARHPGPLLVANFRDDQTHIRVVDLAGNVLKRIPNADGHRLLSTRLDLACAATERNMCRVLNPATGWVHVLPDSLSWWKYLQKPYTSFVFGRIPTTGEYKVLRIFNRPQSPGYYQYQLFYVFTINGPSGSNPDDAQWSSAIQRHTSEYLVEVSSAVIIGEIVYFKVDTEYDAMIGGVDPGICPDCIIRFDLQSEKWMGNLQGPISDIIIQTDGYDDNLDDYLALWSQITLADLGGSIVIVHYRKYQHTMDLWLLKDFDNSLWVKEYIIEFELIFPDIEWCVSVKSLFMLDDGRLLIHCPVIRWLLIYDPRTNTCAQVEMRRLDAVAMYTGNLLSL